MGMELRVWNLPLVRRPGRFMAELRDDQVPRGPLPSLHSTRPHPGRGPALEDGDGGLYGRPVGQGEDAFVAEDLGGDGDGFGRSEGEIHAGAPVPLEPGREPFARLWVQPAKQVAKLFFVDRPRQAQFFGPNARPGSHPGGSPQFRAVLGRQAVLVVKEDLLGRA